MAKKTNTNNFFKEKWGYESWEGKECIYIVKWLILKDMDLQEKSFTELQNGQFEIGVDGDLFKVCIRFLK